MVDLDQTVVDSRVAKSLRAIRHWRAVYDLIPRFSAMPGAEMLFSSSANLKIAVVTNSPTAYAERVLDHFKLRADTIVGFHDTRLKKPYPDPVRLALKRLGIGAEDVWAAGDHPHDIESAMAAGVEVTIGVTMAADDANSLINAKPTVIVPDLVAISELIHRLAC